MKTAPLASMDVAREIRARLKEAFAEEGIRVPIRPLAMPLSGTPMPGASPVAPPPAPSP
jgi:hypothetical protein